MEPEESELPDPYQQEEEDNQQEDFDFMVYGDIPFEQNPYQILPVTKLLPELYKQIQQTQIYTCWQPGWCLLLLREFRWNFEALKARYFDKMEIYQARINFRFDLNQQSDCRRVGPSTCSICENYFPQTFYNICNHNFCLDCWLGHISYQVSSSSPFFKCMSCEVPVLDQTVRAILTLAGNHGINLLIKYQKKICEEFCAENKSYKFCTGLDCNNFIKINDRNVITAECMCGKIFCVQCQSDDHSPCTCQEKTRWIDQVIKEEADAKWMSLNTKLCPWCSKAIERSQGCNFMSCKCGKNFCYLCSRPWEPDHKDHFVCHIYVKKSDEAQNREKEVLDRINHCASRYFLNQKDSSYYRQIDVLAMRNYFLKAIGISLIDSEFLEHSFKFVSESCESLKWVYAYKYCAGKKSAQQEELFDFNLGEYEKYKQNLMNMLSLQLNDFIKQLKLLEDKKKLENHQTKDAKIFEFQEMKKNIINYSTWTRKFQKTFVKDLQQMIIEDDTLEKAANYEELQLNNKKSSQKSKKKSKREDKPQKIVAQGKEEKEGKPLTKKTRNSAKI